MHRKILIECRKIIDQTVESNFTEKTDLLLKTLNMPSQNMTGLFSVIEQRKYMINCGRNKRTDEEHRYMLRYELITDLYQLKKYGPTSRSIIGEETNVYKYHGYIGSLLEVKFQVDYYENGCWDGKPVQVDGDMIRILGGRGFCREIPHIYETTQNTNIINKDYILKKMAVAKKGSILVLYNNQHRKSNQDKILELCLEAAKELGYKEIWVKTLDLYTYLWRCERVI